MSEPTAPQSPPPRKRLFIVGCLTPVILILAGVAGLWIIVGQRGKDGFQAPMGAPDQPAGRLVPWASPPVAYAGPGTLEAHMAFGCREGSVDPNPRVGVTVVGPNVKCKPGFDSQLLKDSRTVLVHLPAGYDPQRPPLPLVVAMHGFGQRPHHVARALLDSFDRAEADGRLPKVVLVMPDMSISGDGTDRPETPFDDTGGSWGVNSNLGRYADHFIDELLPWILKNFRVSDKPEQTILLGGSMGGTIALNSMIDNPRRFPNIGAFYPAMDLLYSCGGSRTTDYRDGCYKSINDDNPERPAVAGPQGPMFTERVFFYPVFDSDQTPGEVWKDNQSVWRRMQQHNPLDRLRSEKPNLTGVHIWYVVGNQDDFNIDSQPPLFNPEAKELGAIIEPENQIRPGRHDIPFIRENLDDAIGWINNRLKANN